MPVEHLALAIDADELEVVGDDEVVGYRAIFSDLFGFQDLIEIGADFRNVRMCAITGEASSSALREDLRRAVVAMGIEQPGQQLLGRLARIELEQLLLLAGQQ